MGNLLATVLLMVFVSTTFDWATYEWRQDRWEKKNPGKRYIRNYRALKKKGLILK